MFTDTVSLLGRELKVLAYWTGEDLHISIFGGDKAHIGAVSILSPDGRIQTICFPDHRDDAVSDLWCQRLKACGVHAAVVETGIHYDNLSKEGIAAVLAACDRLWSTFEEKEINAGGIIS
jgi:hypothetical protein